MEIERDDVNRQSTLALPHHRRYKGAPMGHPRKTLATFRDHISPQLMYGKIVGYFATGSDDERGFAIVQLPEEGALDAGLPQTNRYASVSEQIAAAMEAHSLQTRQLERTIAEQKAYIDEMLHDRDQILGQLAKIGEVEEALRKSEADVRTWRDRTAAAEGEALRLRMNQPDDLEKRIAVLEGELENANAQLAQATDKLRTTEANGDAAWRRVGEIQSELDTQKQTMVEEAAKQRRESQRSVVQAIDEASNKLLSLQNQLQRSEQLRSELEDKLTQSEGARMDAEKRLAAHSDARADSPQDQVSADTDRDGTPI